MAARAAALVLALVCVLAMAALGAGSRALLAGDGALGALASCA